MNDSRFARRFDALMSSTPRSARTRLFLRRHGPMLIGAVVLFTAVCGLTGALFVRSTSALEGQLRETLRAAAISAAYSIDGDALAAIRGPADMESPAYLRISDMLRNVRDDIPQVRFAYILRRTDDPAFLEFVVDADAVSTVEELDRNGNGTVDPDEEPSFPGERYEISESPALRAEAFVMPTTDAEITVDQWGELLSGYAPIRSFETGEVAGVLGIDMDASDFRSRTRSVLSPFAAILIVALAFMLASGVALLVESRQLQMFSRVNAERSGLLQLTFHQLGEPITILQWGIETLDDAKEDAEALKKILPDNLTDMREGVRRLGSIIDTLQEAEKVELGAMENKPVELSAKNALEDVIALVAPAPQDGASRVALETDDRKITVDPHLLTIVLRRLIENALEFSPPGALVRVRAADEGKWIRIDVVDHGCGVPAKDIGHMFEKYHRASNAQVMKPDGNGLGLYIAKGVVELMGGVIGMSSAEGAGTTVTVRLPRNPKIRA